MSFSFSRALPAIQKIAVIASIAIFGIGNVQAATPNGIYADRYAAIVIDANSGKTLFQVNANARRYPASLTKMMTLYLLFEAMQEGRVSPNTPIPVSAHAASRPPTKIGFKPGQTIGAEAAAKALITRSANDVASAIAEYLSGSESRFAQMMTAKARRLGMMNTNFANPSGLPNPNNYSTARDMAILSLSLRQHFPRQYAWFKIESFQYRGQTISSHNTLVKTMKGVDGIKTGYINASGFNVATSMRMDNKSLVAVVMGGRTARLRDAHMAELLRRYLPQATKSKGRESALVAAVSATPSTDVALSSHLPSGHEAPIPLSKKAATAREQDSAILTALASQSVKEQPQAAVAANNAIVKDIDPVITASAPTTARGIVSSGWSVQIGSLPSQSQASEMLSKASSSSAKIALRKASPHTEVFEKNGQRYFRARFTGFNDKKSASDACAALKKANFNCYALSQ